MVKCCVYTGNKIVFGKGTQLVVTARKSYFLSTDIQLLICTFSESIKEIIKHDHKSQTESKIHPIKGKTNPFYS